MINKQEKLVLGWLGKVLEGLSWILIIFIGFIDPIRGRLFEWDWLQITAFVLGIIVLFFSIWLDKFLNVIKDILESV